MTLSPNPQRIQRAMSFLSGRGGPPSLADFAQAADLFKQAQDVPFARAKLAVMTALGCGVDKDTAAASEGFLAAVMGGFPPLMTDMAVIVNACGGAEGLAATLLRQAARRGDMTARFLLVRAGIAGRSFVSREDWDAIKASLPEGAPLVDGSYKEAVPIEPTPINTELMKSATASIFEPAKINAQPKPKMLTDSHVVRAVPNVLSPMQCDYLMAVSMPLMQPSKVVADSGSLHASFRTSDGAVILPAVMDMPMVHILNRLSAAAGAQPEQGEFLSLLRYRPGQEYRPHHDYLSEAEGDYSQVKRTGQRKATLLTYLNSGYGGGETEFPDLDVRYKGEAGGALYFENTDEAGRPLPDSRHAGLAVENGEKWLATLWVRENTFWPWVVEPES